MRVIIAPAKKMIVDPDSLPARGTPRFLEEAETLKTALRRKSPQELQALWKCSGSIAALNVERLARMDLRAGLTPAILAYEGIQYRYMAPGVFTERQLAFVQERLRILSGFYGVLKPLDGVVPYRLEMQAKLSVNGKKDLYDFWDSKLADCLAAETDVILNLASKEYSRAIEARLPAGVRFVTCVFAEMEKDRAVEKGTLCKMARGQMVRWLAEREISRPEELWAFRDLGYRFSETLSSKDRYVFLR